jgi:hypothetical protein
MKRSPLFPVTVAVILCAAVLPGGTTPQAQEKKPTAKEKMATVEYLVGSWSCGHTVGTFSGKYTTKYSKVLGDRWLKETYDFPPGNFGGETEAAVTAEALIGYDEDRGAWVRFFAASHGEYFPIRLKETSNGWAYTYISMFKSRAEKPEADATFTKKSDTEYVIDGPTYPDNGKLVTEHHTCHKM